MRIIIAAFLVLFISCNSQNSSVKQPDTSAASKDTTATAAVTDLSAVAIDNKKDPVCEMPAKGNVNDTAHYEGKVLGFCSAECKTEFLKNPQQYIAAAQITK